MAYLDTLGRPFLTLAHNKVSCRDHALDGTEERFATRVELDIEANQREIIDAKDRVVMRYDYDLLGNRIHQASMEAGERWMLNDVTGNPVRAWDSRGHVFRTEYDPLRRPLRSLVTGADPANANQEVLTERLVYGEQHPQSELCNLRSKLYLHLDQAGAVSNEEHDFKGNPLRATRRLAREYRRAISWSAVSAAVPSNATAKVDPATLEAALEPQLEADKFTSRTAYDALNRPTAITAPDNSTYRPTYNEANLLEKVDVNLRGAAAATHFVANIDYDAKGQRVLVHYGNGAETTYDYDDQTFRLTHLKTTRPVGLNALASQIFADPKVVQDLHYTYDPVGNPTRIEDTALKTVHHNGQQVEPLCSYTYDALYRLIEATGREHISQMAFEFDPPNGNFPDYFFAGLGANPNDLQALRNCTRFIPMSHLLCKNAFIINTPLAHHVSLAEVEG